MKLGGLDIPDPRMLVDSAYNTSKAASEVLVDSLLGVTDLNYINHQGCVHRASSDGWKHGEFLEEAVLTRWKDLADGAGLNQLWRLTENWAWLTAIPHCLNGTNLSNKEF